MSEAVKTPRGGRKAIDALNRGSVLVREHSATERATTKGGGYVYFTHPDGRSIPAIVGKWLIDAGLVVPSGDGLFPELSRTYRVPHGGHS